jgi:hypothetical protein
MTCHSLIVKGKVFSSQFTVFIEWDGIECRSQRGEKCFQVVILQRKFSDIPIV